MEEIPNNQLNLVVYFSIYKVLAPSKRWLALGFLNHQPPGHYSWRESDLCGGETRSTRGFTRNVSSVRIGLKHWRFHGYNRIMQVRQVSKLIQRFDVRFCSHLLFSAWCALNICYPLPTSNIDTQVVLLLGNESLTKKLRYSTPSNQKKLRYSFLRAKKLQLLTVNWIHSSTTVPQLTFFEVIDQIIDMLNITLHI